LVQASQPASQPDKITYPTPMGMQKKQDTAQSTKHNQKDRSSLGWPFLRGWGGVLAAFGVWNGGACACAGWGLGVCVCFFVAAAAGSGWHETKSKIQIVSRSGRQTAQKSRSTRTNSTATTPVLPHKPGPQRSRGCRDCAATKGKMGPPSRGSCGGCVGRGSVAGWAVLALDHLLRKSRGFLLCVSDKHAPIKKQRPCPVGRLSTANSRMASTCAPAPFFCLLCLKQRPKHWCHLPLTLRQQQGKP
jgi:hypothetical protein